MLLSFAAEADAGEAVLPGDSESVLRRPYEAQRGQLPEMMLTDDWAGDHCLAVAPQQGTTLLLFTFFPRSGAATLARQSPSAC